MALSGDLLLRVDMRSGHARLVARRLQSQKRLPIEHLHVP
jgi:hypothetical protein